MIFEYKDDSFAGIHINMNLESAITYAEQLFINLYSIFEAYGLTSKIGIGISTRSMRLVPGNRLISEADQAAQKALDEETMPIVAFKVNHEKYREYVSEEAIAGSSVVLTIDSNLQRVAEEALKNMPHRLHDFRIKEVKVIDYEKNKNKFKNI